MTPIGKVSKNQGKRLANVTIPIKNGSRVKSDANQGKAKADTPSPRFEIAAAENKYR